MRRRFRSAIRGSSFYCFKAMGWETKGLCEAPGSRPEPIANMWKSSCLILWCAPETLQFDHNERTFNGKMYAVE